MDADARPETLRRWANADASMQWSSPPRPLLYVIPGGPTLILAERGYGPVTTSDGVELACVICQWRDEPTDPDDPASETMRNKLDRLGKQESPRWGEPDRRPLLPAAGPYAPAYGRWAKQSRPNHMFNFALYAEREPEEVGSELDPAIPVRSFLAITYCFADGQTCHELVILGTAARKRLLGRVPPTITAHRDWWRKVGRPVCPDTWRVADDDLTGEATRDNSPVADDIRELWPKGTPEPPGLLGTLTEREVLRANHLRSRPLTEKSIALIRGRIAQKVRDMRSIRKRE